MLNPNPSDLQVPKGWRLAKAVGLWDNSLANDANNAPMGKGLTRAMDEQRERLVRLRTLLGFGFRGGQKEFARKINMNYTRYNNYERGVRLNRVAAEQIAAAIDGCHAAWLMWGTRDALQGIE